MLTIRSAQMEVFEAERRRRFEERALRYLREAGGDGAHASLLQLVRAAWDKAGSYGLRNENDVLRLVGICHVFGSNFDADPGRPWVRDILGNPRLSASSKMRVLWARLREET